MSHDPLSKPLSRRARWVHLLFGGLLPIVFLIVDPIVFRSGSDSPYLGAFRAFGYVATTLAAVLVIRAALSPRIPLVEAGMLYGAAAVAFALGVVMIPLTVLGLFLYGVGILGLSPFVASWIYLRQAARHHVALTPRQWSSRAAIGAVLFALICAASQVLVDGSVRWAMTDIEDGRESRVLRLIAPLYDSEQLVREYPTASAEQKRRLSLVYQALTGQMIEIRMSID